MKFDWKALVAVLAPVVLVNVKGGDKLIPLVPVIVSGITSAEELFKDGSDKKAHVLGVTEAAVAAANATGQVELNPVEVSDATSAGVDLVVKVANIVRDAKK